MTDGNGAPFQRVAIVGLGLMGGSLARALKKLPSPPHILVSSQGPRDIRAAKDAGVIDAEARGPEDLLGDRDLVVYATPLRATLDLFVEHGPFIASGTIVTDVVSLKAPLSVRAEEAGLGDRYVGSHPMVGGTGTGFGHSSEDLYAGAPVWLVSGPEVSPESVQRVRALWESLGARTADTTPKEHDESMAWVSHLPQLTSNALALALARAGVRRDQLGSGGTDMTRLAGSASAMWAELLEAAPGNLPAALEAVEVALSELRKRLQSEDIPGITKKMAETREWVEGDL